jgi:hypothetical protein
MRYLVAVTTTVTHAPCMGDNGVQITRVMQSQHTDYFRCTNYAEALEIVDRLNGMVNKRCEVCVSAYDAKHKSMTISVEMLMSMAGEHEEHVTAPHTRWPDINVDRSPIRMDDDE